MPLVSAKNPDVPYTEIVWKSAPPPTQTTYLSDSYNPFYHRQLLRAYRDYAGPERTHRG